MKIRKALQKVRLIGKSISYKLESFSLTNIRENNQISPIYEVKYGFHQGEGADMSN